MALAIEVVVAMEEAVCCRSGVHKDSSSNNSSGPSTNLPIHLNLS